MKDYYYILGIKPNASTDEIKRAYRKLSQKFHPDKNDGDKFFEERFKEINESHETLIDPERRKIYDITYSFKNHTFNEKENNDGFYARDEDFSEKKQTQSKNESAETGTKDNGAAPSEPTIPPSKSIKGNRYKLIVSCTLTSLLFLGIYFFSKKWENDNLFNKSLDIEKSTNDIDYNSFKKLSDRGYSKAYYEVGKYFLFKGDTTLAQNYFQKSIDEGDYLNGGYFMALSKGNSELISWIKKNLGQMINEAGNGDWRFQERLGRIYEGGIGVTQDYKEAMKWFELAADKGYAKAMCDIGLLYGLGDGVAQDYNEAMKWFELAANKGVADAMFNIAVLYAHGDGVALDYNEAMKWYKLAADKGDAEAMFNIGVLYEHGDGVAQDYNEAMKWYKLAADKGDVNAMSNIGILYVYGHGVTRDYKEAMKWFELAANKGVAEAKSALADLKSYGIWK